MSLSQFIRDNTKDGHNIVEVLIDVMNGRLDVCKVGHRLTAARLLTIYGQEDADDFIADNTPSSSGEDERDIGRWVGIDPILTTLIKIRIDDGRAKALFLIDVMEERVEKIHVGHRVAAAKELLNRAFGKSRSRDLPKPPGSSTSRRSTHKTHQRAPSAQTQAVATAPAASTVVLTEPEQQTASEVDSNFDSEVYRAASKCIDSNFDPVLAATSDEYFWNYDGCKDLKCVFHGEPDEFDFDPNDFYY